MAAEVITEVEDNEDTDTPDVTREEVMKVVMRLQSGKGAGEDRTVAELLKSGGVTVIDWLTELMHAGSVLNQEGAPRLEKCYIDTTFQEGQDTVQQLQREFLSNCTWYSVYSHPVGVATFHH